MHKLLGELIGPGPAALYADGCRLRGEQEPYLSTVHLVGHTFREVEGAVREVIAPKHFGAPAQDESQKHKEQISGALDILGLPKDSDVALYWYDAPKFHGLAHRRNLSPRKVDEDFWNTCDRFDALMDTLLTSFQAVFQVCVDRVDQLKSKSDPGGKDVKALRDGVPNHPAIFQRFFDGPLSPKWIIALDAGKFFSDPPENAVMPALDYAYRYAADTSEVSVMIAASLPPISDPYTCSRYVRLLTVLPAEKAALLLVDALVYLERSVPLSPAAEVLISSPLGDLAARLSASGDVATAERILTIVASFSPRIEAEDGI